MVQVILDGYHGDCNETYVVGEATEESKKLIKNTYDSLMKAISIVKPGTPFNKIGKVITEQAHSQGVIARLLDHILLSVIVSAWIVILIPTSQYPRT